MERMFFFVFFLKLGLVCYGGHMREADKIFRERECVSNLLSFLDFSSLTAMMLLRMASCGSTSFAPRQWKISNLHFGEFRFEFIRESSSAAAAWEFHFRPFIFYDDRNSFSFMLYRLFVSLSLNPKASLQLQSLRECQNRAELTLFRLILNDDENWNYILNGWGWSEKIKSFSELCDSFLTFV